MTDQEIIRGIKGSIRDRDATFGHIWHRMDWRLATISLIRRHGGDEQDGDEVFSETLILFDRNIRRDKFEGKSELKTYFLGIAKKCWLKFLLKRRPLEEIVFHHHDEVLPSVEELTILAEQQKYLDLLLAKMSKRCKEIFRLYLLGCNLAEIADNIGLSSPEMAKKEAYRCRMKMRQFLKDHPDWVDLIK